MQEKYVNQNNKKALKIKASEQFTYIYYVNHFRVFSLSFTYCMMLDPPSFLSPVKTIKKNLVTRFSAVL